MLPDDPTSDPKALGKGQPKFVAAQFRNYVQRMSQVGDQITQALLINEEARKPPMPKKTDDDGHGRQHRGRHTT